MYSGPLALGLHTTTLVLVKAAVKNSGVLSCFLGCGRLAIFVTCSLSTGEACDRWFYSLHVELYLEWPIALDGVATQLALLLKKRQYERLCL